MRTAVPVQAPSPPTGTGTPLLQWAAGGTWMVRLQYGTGVLCPARSNRRPWRPLLSLLLVHLVPHVPLVLAHAYSCVPTRTQVRCPPSVPSSKLLRVPANCPHTHSAQRPAPSISRSCTAPAFFLVISSSFSLFPPPLLLPSFPSSALPARCPLLAARPPPIRLPALPAPNHHSSRHTLPPTTGRDPLTITRPSLHLSCPASRPRCAVAILYLSRSHRPAGWLCAVHVPSPPPYGPPPRPLLAAHLDAPRRYTRTEPPPLAHLLALRLVTLPPDPWPLPTCLTLPATRYAHF